MSKIESMIKKFFTLVFILFLCIVYSANAQTNKETDCVFCAQFVPDCGPNERLVPQTCEKCAHCELEEERQEATTSCQKCLIHAQCPYWHKCIDGCCVKKPHRRNPDVVLKKDIRDTINRISTAKKQGKITSSCNNPCGIKCCKPSEKCITIDQCKGIKGKCKLPMLKFCSTKSLEKITGQLSPL